MDEGKANYKEGNLLEAECKLRISLTFARFLGSQEIELKSLCNLATVLVSLNKRVSLLNYIFLLKYIILFSWRL
jgi:hypothetical protein